MEENVKKRMENKDKDIPNVEIVKVLYGFCKKHKNVKFTHFRAHT